MKLFCISKQTRLFIFGKVTLMIFLILRLYKEKVLILMKQKMYLILSYLYLKKQ